MDHDYASAAARHLRDASFLHEGQAWDNAAYLTGYVAECSVKAVVERAGRVPQIHLQEFSPRILVMAADLGWAARRYRIDLDPDLDALVAVWDTRLRYSKTGTVTKERSEQTLKQARQVFQRTVGRMVLDGLYSQVPR